jgi:hypothetical protein
MYGAFGISCHSNTTCEVVGDSDSGSVVGYAVGTTTGGTSWKVQAVPSGQEKLYAVSCASATVCAATGLNEAGKGKVRHASSPTAIITTTNGGASWTSRTPPAGVIFGSSLVCPTPSVCEGVGELQTMATEVIGSSNEGATWKAQTSPSTKDVLEGVSCKVSASCMVAVQVRKSPTSISGEVLVSTKVGGPWTTRLLPSTDHAPVAVSCASTVICELAGNDSSVGFVLRTLNGGKTWKAQRLP